MCAIIGACLKSPTEQQIETIKEIFKQSQIRGKHATGVAYLDKLGDIVRRMAPEPAEEFVAREEKLFSALPSLPTLKLIGHCRYSTSDLEYNQPIALSPELAIVHNGVVDQRPPEHWSDYGWPLETKNDSELIWRCLINGEEPLEHFPEASMAVGELWRDGVLRFYRNGKRPLWLSTFVNGYVVTSTRDIALRSGLPEPKPFPPGAVYHRGVFTTIVETNELIPYGD